MSTVIPFSEALRERTAFDCVDNDPAGFMNALISGRGSRDDYVQLVAQHYFIYDAIEAAAARMRSNPVAAPFISAKLTRLPAIREDLRFLLGDDWGQIISPLPSTSRYVARIEDVAATWAGGFIAHHYTRYLGDLSGGQLIRTLMKRRFGFETNGVGFYLFADIARPREFKATYRAQLDAVGWSESEQARVIDEVMVAYRFTTEMFIELAASRSRAA